MCLNFLIKLSFLLVIVICESTFKLLSTDKSVQEYKQYCEAKRSQVPKANGYKLIKVIIIHRHGDRTPINMYKSKWEEENCCLCQFKSTQNVVSDCNKTKCNGGDLTLKGYKQLKSLGEFIKTNYKELINDINKIDIYVTNFSRTWSSVFGLINGIKPTEKVRNVKKAPEYSLYPVENCENRVNLVSTQNSSYYDALRTEFPKISPERMSDNLFTHVCNDIKVNCEILTCDSQKTKQFIDANRQTWSEDMKIIEKNERIIKLDFGILANKLLELFQNDTKMHIFSAHDNSISSILTGFGSGIYEKPSYASSIMIEKLSKDNLFFYRLIYNGTPIKTIINPDNVILKENEFNEYLKLLKITRNDIQELCSETT